MKRDMDDIIKETMQDWNVPYDPDSWADLQQRMDEDIDGQFDDELRAQVDGLRQPYTHSHWLQLKDWLDYSWYASNKVYFSKAAEAVLMMLALFTCFNNGWNTSKDEVQQQVASVETLSNNAASTFNPNPTQLTLQGGSTTETPTKVANDFHQKQDASTSFSKEMTSDKTGLSEGGLRTTNSPGSHVSGISNDLPTSINDNLSSAQSETRHASAAISVNRSSHTIGNGITEVDANDLAWNDGVIEPMFALERLEAVNAQPLLENQLVAYSGRPDETMSEGAPQFKIKPKSKKNWSLSAFMDIDFNHISTPFDQDFQKTGYNQNRIGTGGGIMVHRDLGKVELSTGVIYASKQYSPDRFVELFKRTPEDIGTAYRFEGIRLNVLTIPVHASIYFNKSGAWRPYFTTGAAVHLALQAEYDKEAETLEFAAPAPIGALETIGEQPRFERKKFPDGLLEDGPFKENHYFTIDLGVGVERSISPSTSLFVQPTVFYNLFNKGVSANNDKINTFSLLMGVKSRL